MPDAARFALALQRIDGIGRVTAGRLLRHFDSFEALRRCPREQVLLRIRGAPNAEALVQTLFDEAATQPALDAARAELDALRRKRIAVLTPHHAAWPARLDALPRSERPAVLYAFGSLEALGGPVASLLARPPLEEGPFEQAQALVGRLAERQVAPAAGVAHGFDVVVLKRAARRGRPAVMVARAGLRNVPRPLRPAISEAVRAGGVLLSPFPMAHGPYDHDEDTCALLLAALADAAVFLHPRPETPERRALRWAVDAGRPSFVLSSEDESAPEDAFEGVRRLAPADDLQPILDAAAR